MTMELLVKLGERMRDLTPDEFDALRDLVDRGVEVDAHLDRVSSCLLDMIAMTDEHNGEPRMRIAQ